MANDRQDGEAVVIKKYANRRLYNTATSSYVTLDGLARMVKEGVEFTVCDARTGEDITRSVLTQIIVEEEARGVHLLPIGFLRQLIGFYGDGLQAFVPRYLEMSMEHLARNQERLRGMTAWMFPFSTPQATGALDEMVRSNMALFQRALQAFQPEGGDAAAADKGGGDKGGGDLEAMKERIDALQRQLDELAARR